MGDSHRYLIEVLMRGRDYVSQVAQKVQKSLDGVTEAQKRNDQASKASAAATQRQVQALEQLRQAHVREKKAAEEAHREALNEAAGLRDLARARQDQLGKIDKTAKALTSQAKASRLIGEENRRLAQSWTSSIKDIDSELAGLTRNTKSSERDVGRFGRSLSRVGISSGEARSGLRGLSSEFSGFRIAVVIKYAQALISVLVGLAGQLFAVAAAAAQAGAALGAALASGAAQAVPVVGVLIAAFARLGSVLDAVKLQNQQQLTATQDSTRADKAQSAAAEQVRSAQQRVADAHRNVQRAVEDLTDARREGIRTVQDLLSAELNAAQALESAKAGRTRAIESGDVAGTVQADIEVDQARRGVTRARQDAAPVRARGVEGLDAVAQAHERVSDARRDEIEASRDLNRTRRQSAEDLTTETAAVNKLADARKQLSGAERRQFDRIIALQATYKRVARPITDIITRAFTDVIDRVNSLLQDSRIIRGFRNIAVQVAAAIRTVTGELGGNRSVGAFEVLSAEAARNIPIATKILINFFRIVRNIAIQAIPAFRLLLDYVGGYAKLAEDATRNSKGLSDFFVTGIKYARSFFELGLAIVDLFLALAGSGGGASEGRRTIDELTGSIDDLTRKVRSNADSVRDFFREAHDVLFAVLGVLGNIGLAMLGAFSSKSVQTFADFLNRVIIPALETVIKIMGSLVSVFHQVFALPGVAEVAQIAATVLILARGLTIIATAFGSISKVLPGFAAAMRLSPAVVPWIAAIMGVVAAVVLLDKKLHFLGPTWRWIKRAASDAWEGIKDAAAATISWFRDVWTQGLLYWIRWPFVWLAENAAGPAFGWVREAVGDLLAWLKNTFGDGGDFALIGDLIVLPFRLIALGIRGAFAVIKTIIIGTLDLIAGRFDHFGELMSDFWAGFIDVGRGAISSLLGVLGDLLGALGKIPKIGGPFKEAAKDIRNAQDNIDSMRDSTKKQRQEQKRANDAVEEARGKYRAAKAPLEKLTKGTDEYRAAARIAKDRQRDLNRAISDAKNVQRPAARSFGVIAGSVAAMGQVVADVSDSVGNNVNSVLGELGAKALRFTIKRPKKAGKQVGELAGALGALAGGATGGVLDPRLGIRRKLWGGGVPNPYGGAADDHILMAPGGRPVAALSGSEGIVNTPQMGVINQALSFTQQMGGGGYGSLNDLWGSGMRHYAAGGRLRRGGGIVPIPDNPGESILAPILPSLIRLLRRYDARVTDGYATSGHASNSDHYWGGAVDLVPRRGNWNKIDALARYAEPSQNNPRAPFRWVGYTGDANHGRGNHLHLSWMRGRFGLPGGPMTGGVGQVQMPRISGLGNNAQSRIARASARKMTRAANRYLERQAGMGGAGADSHKAMGADANVVAAFRRAIRVTGAKAKARLALWMAGIVESGLKNLTYGDRDSVGALQLRAGLHGRALALNPYGSALAFLRRGFTGRGGAISLAERNRGMSAGQIAQAVQGSAYPSRYDQVRGQAMRYLAPGGLLKGSVSAPRAVAPRQAPLRSAALNLPNLIGRGMSPALTTIASLFADVTERLETVARGPLRRSKNLTRRIARALSRIVDDGGLLDQMREQTETITARAAAALQRRQFRVTARGPGRRNLTESQVAQGELQGLQGQRTGLLDEREATTDSIRAAQRSIREAQRRGNKKAERAAQSALIKLRTRLETNSNALAQNAQDQVEAQERFQQGLLSEVNDAAERQNGSIDRWSRMAKALGQKLDPNAVLGRQINNMRDQIGGLQGVLASARRSGNRELANQVKDQIAELNVQIAEAVAQQFQNSIDAVNNSAARQNAGLDRQDRLARLGGRTNFGAVQENLQQRGRVMILQSAGLQDLRRQAEAAGNLEQVENLTDQIDELAVQMQENTQATKDNTNAAFDFQTSQINEAAGFSQGVFGSVQSFFQALTESTGIDTTGQQQAALSGTGASLAAQQSGLSSQLASLIGSSAVLGLDGAGLVNYLTSISSGPAFNAIMKRLDPTQQAAFKDLVNALLGNATATVQNTQAIDQMTNPGAQSFSSTLWSTFRSAVFTGAGGLLPQYQSAIPTAAVGARIQTSGMLVAHAGETIRPASVSRDWGSGGGDSYELNVTTPTEVLNPTDVARQLAFYRKSQGR